MRLYSDGVWPWICLEKGSIERTDGIERGMGEVVEADVWKKETVGQTQSDVR